ncbi:hypothetical protein BDC45DRAFT_569055 [Circinella umbellata]|nr:hypothetical protein BDC45DRAFT_569055 [Circinella umbellata]
MPPKSALKGSVQQELQELRRQITNIAQDQEVLYTAQNELAGALRELKQEFETKTQEILYAINDLKEISRNHITRSSSFETLTSDVIKNDINADVPYSQAEAIYNTALQERRLALNLLSQRLASLSENNGQGALDDEMHDEEMKVGWGSIDERERKITIDAFKDAVFERTSVNLKLCEEDWAAIHMLSEGWGNRRQPQEQIGRRSRGSYIIGDGLCPEPPSPHPSSPHPSSPHPSSPQSPSPHPSSPQSPSPQSPSPQSPSPQSPSPEPLSSIQKTSTK